MEQALNFHLLGNLGDLDEVGKVTLLHFPAQYVAGFGSLSGLIFMILLIKTS